MLSAQESPVFGYIRSVPREGLTARLSAHLEATATLFAALPEAQAGYAYAPGKWTVRQLVGHVLISQRLKHAANGTRLRPQEILRALIGHESHHLRMLAERYRLGLLAPFEGNS